MVFRSTRSISRPLRISTSTMEAIMDFAADRTNCESVSLNGISGGRSINKCATGGRRSPRGVMDQSALALSTMVRVEDEDTAGFVTIEFSSLAVQKGAVAGTSVDVLYATRAGSSPQPLMSTARER